MKGVIPGLFALAIIGVLGIAVYGMNKSDGCVRLAVPTYLEFGYCPTDRKFQDVYFESGKSEIPRSEYNKLYELLDYLNKNKNRRVRLIGNTDGDPGIDHQTLSDKRANSVKLWLEDQGIEEERIRAYGQGHSNPVLGHDLVEDKSKSRRVEIEIR